MPDQPIDYLCIGHCCHDKVGEDFLLGGTASYSSMVAKAFGLTAGVLTSIGPDFLYRDQFQANNISFYEISAKRTTVFENRYDGPNRTQILHARANTIKGSDVPTQLTKAKIVHLSPIADEIDPDIPARFQNALLGASIQGFLRKWNSAGLVSPKRMDLSILKSTDVTILSTEDIIGLDDFLQDIIQEVSHVVVTEGGKGAKVYIDKREYFFPSFPVTEVDATGAGDVFTTAYLFEFERTGDIQKACNFGHCAASFIVEAQGLHRIPSLTEIHERLELHGKT